MSNIGREAVNTAVPISVKIESLSKTFRSKKSKVQVLDSLSLDVTKGEMLVLLGPSGCGKTTLLRCIVGLEQADDGAIQLGGKLVAKPSEGLFVPADKRGVGMVFQNYALWPHMTVARNVEFPLRARGMTAEIHSGRVREVLDIVQCGHLADRYPPQLSGGQQQRISLARALACRPDVMLLDEPLSNLDALLRIDLRAQLRQLHRTVGFTGIYVTHDQVEAMNLGTRVVVMRSGRIEQIGAPETIYRRPANEYVAEFLGMRNRLAVTIDASSRLAVGGASLPLPAGSASPGSYTLRTRGCDILLGPPGAQAGAPEGVDWISGGRVIDRLPSGETTDYIVAIGNETIFAEQRGSRVFDKGDQVDIGINTRAMLLYGEGGDLAPFV